MNTADLRKILDEHKIWIESFRENGSRANLSDADLSGAYLSDYDLLYRFDDEPYPEEKSNSVDELTARDYFAAGAMASIVRRYDGHSFGGGSESPQYKELARDAYFIADAMLKARGE